MDRQADTSGDYGYDLAHEATGRRAVARQPTGGDEPESRPAETSTDRGGDLEYDEAHDF